MPFSIVASGAKAGAAGGVTTDAADTTGADLIVLSVVSYAAVAAPTLSDSKGNTWTGLTARDIGISRNRLYYCVAPTVGAGHTFALAGSTVYASLGYVAASGAHATPFHSQAGATNTAASLQPGSVTPPEDGCLVVSGLTGGTGTGYAIGSGFAANAVDYGAGTNMGGGIARLIQGTAAAVNPTWSWTPSADGAATIAVFLPGAVVGPSPAVFAHHHRQLMRA